MRKLVYILVATALLGNTARAEDSPVESYLALSAAEAIPDLSVLREFPAVFERLEAENLKQRVEAAYASTIFFNDTLVTLTSRDELVEYLAQSGEKTNHLAIRILDVATSGENVYVRWQMEMSFDVMGTERKSNSVGMTHLRFDRSGKIILHQDFWDSAGGFYQTLPVVGRMIRWVKNGLHP